MCLKGCLEVVLLQVPQACIGVLESFARWASLPEILLSFQDFMRRYFVCTCGSSYGGSCHTHLWWLISSNRSYSTRMAYSYWKLLDASWPYLLRYPFLLLHLLLASYYQLLLKVEQEPSCQSHDFVHHLKVLTPFSPRWKQAWKRFKI